MCTALPKVFVKHIESDRLMEEKKKIFIAFTFLRSCFVTVSLIQDYENECACKAYGENHVCVRYSYFGRKPEGRNDLRGLEVEECLVKCKKEMKCENMDWLPSSVDTVEPSQQRNVYL